MNVHHYRCERLEPEVTIVTIDAAPGKRAVTVINVDALHSVAMSGIKKSRRATSFTPPSPLAEAGT